MSVETVDGHVVLRVADAGPGLDPALAGRLFERFAHTGGRRDRT